MVFDPKTPNLFIRQPKQVLGMIIAQREFARKGDRLFDEIVANLFPPDAICICHPCCVVIDVKPIGKQIRIRAKGDMIKL